MQHKENDSLRARLLLRLALKLLCGVDRGEAMCRTLVDTRANLITEVLLAHSTDLYFEMHFGCAIECCKVTTHLLHCSCPDLCRLLLVQTGSPNLLP